MQNQDSSALSVSGRFTNHDLSCLSVSGGLPEYSEVTIYRACRCLEPDLHRRGRAAAKGGHAEGEGDQAEAEHERGVEVHLWLAVWPPGKVSFVSALRRGALVGREEHGCHRGRHRLPRQAKAEAMSCEQQSFVLESVDVACKSKSLGRAGRGSCRSFRQEFEELPNTTKSQHQEGSINKYDTQNSKE